MVLSLNQFADLHIDEFSHLTPSKEEPEELKKKELAEKQDTSRKKFLLLNSNLLDQTPSTGSLLLQRLMSLCHILEVRTLLAGELTSPWLSNTL